MSQRYDAVVIGAGPSGEACARRLCAGGLRVALVERKFIGGESAQSVMTPGVSIQGVVLGSARAFRHPPSVSSAMAAAIVGQREPTFNGESFLDPSDLVLLDRTTSEGIKVLRGSACITGPGRVRVAGTVLITDHIIIATGSIPRIPDIEGLEEAGYWTSRDAMTFRSLPESVVVLGDGTQAIELAQSFCRCGSEVTILAQGNRLLLQEDPAVGQLLARHLHDCGVRLILGRSVRSIERDPEGMRVITLDDGLYVRSRELLVAAGRIPQIAGLGLEHTDVRVHAHGIQIDEYCRAAEGIWAIGDVTGVGYFIHVAHYQARIAADNILGQSHPAHYESVPRIAFTDPQFAAAGLTLAEAQKQGLNISSITVDLLPGACYRATGREVGGTLTLHVDRDRGMLVGAWAVAPAAATWIEFAVLAIRATMPITVLRDLCEQQLTFSEIYLQALDQLAADVWEQHLALTTVQFAAH